MCAKLALLWHMHQPCYKDPGTGGYGMPWVFLHAAKDYAEMLSLALEGEARVTFNFVPILLDQLEDYSRPDVKDDFLDLLQKDPLLLTGDEKSALAKQLLMLNTENQARRYGRLNELTTLLGRKRRAGESLGQNLKREDWLDLEVLYLVAWTGEITRRENPFIARLAEKGEGFTQEEKLELVNELKKLCGDTAVRFRRAAEAGRIELSCTPYCHPILPLLVDVNSAKVAVPEIKLPDVKPGVFGDDAAVQVREAVARHRDAFGKSPAGFWPSEGSVSPEVLGILAANGVSWAATDEDILAASLGVSLTGQARGALYRPYRAAVPGGITVFFRDKALSDLIGFVYSSWPAKNAAADFIHKLEDIARAHGPESVITVALDGENAWEHYPENGAPFLRELYAAVKNSREVEFAAFADLAGADAPVLPKIHSGSWIYGSFTTWIGHSEKNRAWELLSLTREAVGRRWESLGEDEKGRIWSHLRVAEGSDWFWWLGDDHFTPLAGRFDELFRARLMAVHRELGEPEPPSLRLPIKRVGRRGLVRRPKDRVRPAIDGRVGSFFEWINAGVFDLGFDAGSMHRTDSLFGELLFGTDGQTLYLCLESKALAGEIANGASLEVLAGPEESVVAVADREGKGEGRGAVWAVGEAVEIGIPLSNFPRDGENRVNIGLRLTRDGRVLERAPLFNMAEFVPEAEKSAGGWSV